MEIVLGLVAVLAGGAWGSFLLFRYLSMRNVHRMVEHGEVHIRITLRGTEMAVWREPGRGAAEGAAAARPIRRVS